MKILYVGADAQVCGASFSMLKLVEEEEKLGINVVPVVHKGNSERILSKTKKNYYVVNAWSWSLGVNMSRYKKMIYKLLKSLLNIPCYFQYLSIIRKENPDIVHINALTTYTIALAAIKMKKPVVWHIREMMEEDLGISFWDKEFAYKLMKKANMFIAISECVKNKYENIVGSEKIRLIYNGIDKDLFFDEKHTIFQKNQIIITLAGRITKKKGQLLCLYDLAPVLKDNPNVILQFAGTGTVNDLQEIKRLRDELKLTENQVRLLGHVDDMAKLWKETDIAIVYSKCEAFGRVTIEAKMAGALVVGFDSGGTSELIKNGVDGYLFDRDTRLLADTINMILNNKEKSKNIAQVGRDHSSEIFTSENNAMQIYNLYQELLKYSLSRN